MPHTQTLVQLSQALQSKKISSVELCTHYLQRIQSASSLNAFISVDEELALAAAKDADHRIATKQATPLTGLPLAHKDNFCTSNLKTTCASKMLADFYAPYDATIVQHFSNAGCVMLGKTNLDEFAMGSSNETSFFGPVSNPWAPQCVPGGSSGGSAAAVAARLAPIATGTDTGGSIRQPAALCNISGLKPTYGLVSRYGMVSYASSFDQAGLFAPSAEDLAFVLPTIAKFDVMDSTSIKHPIPDYMQTLNEPIQSLTIGLPRCFFHIEVDLAIQEAVWNAIEVYKQLGAKIVEIDLSLYEHWIPCYYALACAEASSNLARYDGVRYGHRSQKANTLRDLVSHSRTEGLGDEVKRRILTGTYILAEEQFDAYYIQAQKVRHLISLELQETLSHVDVLLGPTTPTLAFPIGASNTNPLLSQLSDIFTVVANLVGLPAVSIPIGFQENLPMGLQLIGPHFGEAMILQAAHAYQKVTDWHTRIPEGESL
ncbi:MAG: Asp-tRNA(Asn)/Glu-tRNA(Gln) amidotransferase subunit GatA [Gammaproteobacteria bacterium]|nr:Asp-tRNA(Asn)/Glu-tRNA(Gln) amidotransferase subunit GatA [Gammaproteobacteria bacterium]